MVSIFDIACNWEGSVPEILPIPPSYSTVFHLTQVIFLKHGFCFVISSNGLSQKVCTNNFSLDAKYKAIYLRIYLLIMWYNDHSALIDGFLPWSRGILRTCHGQSLRTHGMFFFIKRNKKVWAMPTEFWEKYKKNSWNDFDSMAEPMISL